MEITKAGYERIEAYCGLSTRVNSFKGCTHYNCVDDTQALYFRFSSVHVVDRADTPFPARNHYN